MNRSTKFMLSLVVVAGMVSAAGASESTYKPDPWITMKTKLALLTAEDVPAAEINVDTVNGRVTLHGKVSSAAEKARAAEVAKGIEGTVSVTNLVQVVPDTRKPAMDVRDEDVKKRVEAALDRDADLHSSHITVQSVNNGVVLLAGKATSLSDHLRAVQTARRIDGVRRVASEVESPGRLTERELRGDTASTEPVRSDGARGGLKQDLSDSWITTATKLRLLADDATPALSINVDTDEGIVTLFGVVPTQEAKKAAEAQASRVSGVRSVVNSLQVVPESAQAAVAASDEDVKNAVESALGSREDMKHVSVEVKNGVARLTGTVPDSADRLQASLVVRAARGVRSVQNDLRVAIQ